MCCAIQTRVFNLVLFVILKNGGVSQKGLRKDNGCVKMTIVYLGEIVKE